MCRIRQGLTAMLKLMEFLCRASEGTDAGEGYTKSVLESGHLDVGIPVWRDYVTHILCDHGP